MPGKVLVEDAHFPCKPFPRVIEMPFAQVFHDNVGAGIAALSELDVRVTAGSQGPKKVHLVAHRDLPPARA